MKSKPAFHNHHYIPMKATRIVTPLGPHDANTVFAAAMMSMIYPELPIMHSGDADYIAAEESIVVGCGGIYNPIDLRFDHRKLEMKDRERANGQPYATAGLVWKLTGQALAIQSDQTKGMTFEELQEIVDLLDVQFVQRLDASVFSTDQIPIDTLSLWFNQISAARLYEGSTSQQYQEEKFKLMLAHAKTILNQFLCNTIEIIKGFKLVRKAAIEGIREVLVLDQELPWLPVVWNEFPDFSFVVYPHSSEWRVAAVPMKSVTGQHRKVMPESWRGKTEHELTMASGIFGGRLCLDDGTLLVASDKEAAMRYAINAL